MNYCPDSYGNQVFGIIKVFPSTVNIISFNPTKDYPSIFEIIDGINSGLDFSKHKILTFTKKPEGNIQISGGYKEDLTTCKAFYAFAVSGGFDPLISLALDVPFPILSIATAIPDVLLDWLANVYAFIRVEGKITLSIDFERFGSDDYTIKGGASVSVSGSVGFGLKVANGKLLLVEASLGVGVKGEGVAFAEADVCGSGPDDKKWKIGAKVSVNFDDVEGLLAWKFFDAKMGKAKKIQIKKGFPIMEDKECKLFSS